MNARDSEDSIALHTAAAFGKTGIVRVLIDAGSDVNAFDSRGDTPLHVSAGSCHVDVVGLLLDKGADLSAVDKESLTPAGCAKLLADSEVEKYLEEKSCLRE